MRIACDLDGVLADLHDAYARTALRLFPELEDGAVLSPEVGASPPDAEAVADAAVERPASAAIGKLALTSAQSDLVWRTLADVENFWETLGEIEPGTIARLAELADERRWELLFISSRPRSAGGTVQRQTQRWLQRAGFPLPSVYIVHGSRGAIAKALQLDIVVDDRPENCLDVVLESQAAAILVWRGARKDVPASARRMGIAVVPTVADCLDAIVTIEDADGGSSLLDRVRRMFGLKTSRSAVMPSSTI